MGYTRKVTQFFPVIQVEVICEQDRIQAKGYEMSSADINDENAENDITSCSTNRGLAMDCPTFSVSFVWRNSWFSKLRPNDLVIISMGRPNSYRADPLEPVMFGLIDDVRKTWDFQTSKPRRTITITGRGFAKAFANFEIGMIKSATYVGNNLAMMMITGVTVTQMTAAEGIGSTVDAFTKNGIDYNFGQGRTFASYFSKDLSSSSDPLTDCIGSEPYQGSVWSFLKELQNAPFNEMFWEVKNKKPTLILRETPFDSKDWNSLECFEVPEDSLINDNTGFSDIEAYTVYETILGVYGGYTGVEAQGFFPLWYSPNYKKYGLRKLSVTSPYTTCTSVEEVSSAVNTANRYTRKLFDWNILNHLMMNGNITVRGQAYYKVGSRLLVPHDETEYYIESVAHQYSMYGSFITTLGVTRGIYPGHRFMTPVGGGETFDISKEIEVMYGNLTQDGVGRRADNIQATNQGGVFASNSTASSLITGQEASDFVQPYRVIVNGDSLNMNVVEVGADPYMSLRELQAAGIIVVQGDKIVGIPSQGVSPVSVIVDGVTRSSSGVLHGGNLHMTIDSLANIGALRTAMLPNGMRQITPMSGNIFTGGGFTHE